MGNRKERKVLTAVIVALGVILCLLIGISLLLRYRTTDSTFDAPVNFQSGASGLSSADEAGTQSAGEVSDEKTEKEVTSAPSPAPEDLIPAGTGTEHGESKPAESKGADEEEQGNPSYSTRPTESGHTETVPVVTIDISNMTDEF